MGRDGQVSVKSKGLRGCSYLGQPRTLPNVRFLPAFKHSNMAELSVILQIYGLQVLYKIAFPKLLSLGIILAFNEKFCR